MTRATKTWVSDKDMFTSPDLKGNHPIISVKSDPKRNILLQDAIKNERNLTPQCGAINIDFPAEITDKALSLVKEDIILAHYTQQAPNTQG